MIAQTTTLARLLLSYLTCIRYLRMRLKDILSLEGFGVWYVWWCSFIKEVSLGGVGCFSWGGYMGCFNMTFWYGFLI